MKFIIDYTLNFALFIALIGISIIYFGKLFVKSNKELTADSISWQIHGLRILGFILIPIFAISIIFKLVFMNTQPIPEMLLIGAQGILIILSDIWILNNYKKVNRLKRWFFNYLFLIANILILIYFIRKDDLFFLAMSILLFVMQMTYFSGILGTTERIVNIHLEKPVMGKKIFEEVELKRLGDSFIDIYFNKKEITLNKSNILFMERPK